MKQGFIKDLFPIIQTADFDGEQYGLRSKGHVSINRTLLRFNAVMDLDLDYRVRTVIQALPRTPMSVAQVKRHVDAGQTLALGPAVYDSHDFADIADRVFVLNAREEHRVSRSLYMRPAWGDIAFLGNFDPARGKLDAYVLRRPAPAHGNEVYEDAGQYGINRIERIVLGPDLQVIEVTP